MDYKVGYIVRTKKPHPCGSKLWEITRVGVDFKLKCQGCGHIVILDRPKAIKMITKIEKRAMKIYKDRFKNDKEFTDLVIKLLDEYFSSEAIS